MSINLKLPAIVASLAAATLVLAGCAAPGESTADAASGTDAAFPVTLEHAFGETTIEAAPERVVTWGWGSTEAALAVGVVPVAMPFQSYGGDENGILPWTAEKLEELGVETPEVLPDATDELPFEDIAAAEPDLILAVFSGITAEDYELLSEIAPTVAYVGEAWTTPWKDVVTTVGDALGRSAEAEAVLADIDEQLATAAAEHPELEGKTVAAVSDVAGTFYVYKKADARVEFLFDLGLESAPSVDELSNGDSTFYYTLSYEQLDKLDADILISYSDTQDEADAFLSSSHGLAIPAVKAGAVASVVGTEFVAAVSPPTALSLTWGLDGLVELLSAAASR